MRIKWTDRRFNFDFPAGIYPEMIERVRGTPARLEDLLAGLSPEILTTQADGRWSMQENAGHLLDLESLVMQRIDEYLAGNTTLHAADMSNRKTFEAHHNEVATGDNPESISHSAAGNCRTAREFRARDVCSFRVASALECSDAARRYVIFSSRARRLSSRQDQ